MNPRVRRQTCLDLLKVGDLLNLGLAFLISYSYARSGLHVAGLREVLSAPLNAKSLFLLSLTALLWHLCFMSRGLYHSRRLSSRKSELGDVVVACCLGCAGVVVALAFEPGALPMARFLVAFLPCTTTLALLSRLVMRVFLGSMRRHGRNLRFILIFGTNPRAVQFARTLDERPEFGYRIAGFVDDDWSGLRDFQQAGFSRVADLRSYPDFLRNNVVDEVSICLPIQSNYQKIAEIMAQCTTQGIVTRLLKRLRRLRIRRNPAPTYPASKPACGTP